MMMTRVPLIAIVLLGFGGAVWAQSDPGLKSFEPCFVAARAADPICSDPANDAVQRLDCLQKARKTLLECLEQVQSQAAAGSPPAKTTGTAALETPPATRELTTASVSPDKPSSMTSAEASPATAAPDKPPASTSAEAPAAMAAPDKSSEATSPEVSAVAAAPEKPAATAAPEAPAENPAPARATETASVELPAATVPPSKPAAAISPEPPARVVDVPSKPRETNWVVSETTSPVDFTPLITAVIRSQSSVKDAPNEIAIRCRGGRSELMVRTPGKWSAPRAHAVLVDYQINDKTPVTLPWTLSADGKTASYKDDAIGFLQSLPQDARLKIAVLDERGSAHDTTFDLAGWDSVRGKLAAACKWAPAAGKISAEKR
jgi:hypothetical protein